MARHPFIITIGTGDAAEKSVGVILAPDRENALAQLQREIAIKTWKSTARVGGPFAMPEILIEWVPEWGCEDAGD